LPVATQIKHEPGTPLPQLLLKPKLAFCVQEVVSPILATLFLHYALDMRMARTWPAVPFERYAAYAICHCRTRDEAEALQAAPQEHFAACKLVLHPQKTKIVYCNDTNRKGRYPHPSPHFMAERVG